MGFPSMTFLVQLPVESYPVLLPLGFDTSGAYSFATARAMMWLSQLAYEPDAKIDVVLQHWQLTPLAHLHAPPGPSPITPATQGFVCRSADATIVAFAGTDPGVLATVLTDVNTLPGAGTIHTGFAEAIQAVWADLVPLLQAPGPARLLVTGHSLGAALAVLTAFRAHNELHKDANLVYTFGLPRVGGGAFVAEYEPVYGASTFRFVDGDDPVPAMPPVHLGYQHVGRAFTCPHAGTFEPAATPPAERSNDPILAGTEAALAGHTIRELLDGRLPVPAQSGILGDLFAALPGGLADHMQARYLKALGTPVLA